MTFGLVTGHAVPDMGPARRWRSGNVVEVDLEDILAEEAVAGIFGVTPKTLRNWATIGHGPVRVTVGRNSFYSRRDVRAWLGRVFMAADASMREKNPPRVDYSLDQAM
jgi:hypothetical protein